jgi:YesN/AraC family two-component response regulator
MTMYIPASATFAPRVSTTYRPTSNVALGAGGTLQGLVGESVMRYLAGWRMHLALSSLREEKVDIGRLAERVGYQSESAFNRAFKRYVGMSPGAARGGTQTDR